MPAAIRPLATARTSSRNSPAVTSAQALPARREKTTSSAYSVPLVTTSSVRLPVDGTVTWRAVEYSRTLYLWESGAGAELHLHVTRRRRAVPPPEGRSGQVAFNGPERALRP